MAKYEMEISSRSLVKDGEELCGDKVYGAPGEESSILILADGLGSGVKANILATLTSKIAAEMLRGGAPLEEVVQTIANTLPVCRIRNVAYSTFTIFQVFRDGKAYLAEYDNPPAFRFRDGLPAAIPRKERIVNGRLIRESFLETDERDTFLFVSDGVVHAGIGGILNLGWKWEHVEAHIQEVLLRTSEPADVAQELTEACSALYEGRPGDDATVVCVRVRPSSPVAILAGPPEDPESDADVVERWTREPGKKVICGGTTANIVSRLWGEPIQVLLPSYGNGEVPPIGSMKGVALVTEGVLTLHLTLQRLKELKPGESPAGRFRGDDGVSRLLKLLLEEATEVRFYVGTAINPAHQNPDFPRDLNIKLKIIEEIRDQLLRLGKKTEILLF